jgi:hypothetical protein
VRHHPPPPFVGPPTAPNSAAQGIPLCHPLFRHETARKKPAKELVTVTSFVIYKSFLGMNLR